MHVGFLRHTMLWSISGLFFLTGTIPAQADNPFEPDLLEQTEVEIETQPQEKENALTPYVFYGYKEDKLFITTRDGQYTFVPTVTLQLRHQNLWQESELLESTFRLRRARLQVDGTFLSPALKYEADLELRTPNTDDDPMRLQDFYVDYAWHPALRLRGGQFKLPYSYQFILSGTRQQFNERSIANATFSPGRDIGLMLHGRTLDQSLNYAVGVFNGEGQNRWDQNQRPAALAHLRWTPLGRYATEESDLEGGDLRVLTSVQSWVNHTASDQMYWDNSLFAGLKYQGLSVQGQFFLRNGMSSETANELNQWGFYGQTGYFFLKDWEAALRVAQVSPSGTAAALREYGTALNYYIQGHHLKFQLDYTLLEEPGTASPWRHRVIGQMQLSF